MEKKKVVYILVFLLIISFSSCSLFSSYEPTDDEISRASLAIEEGLSIGIISAMFETPVDGIDITTIENTDGTGSIIMDFTSYEVVDGSGKKYYLDGTMKMLDWDIVNDTNDLIIQTTIESSSFGDDIEFDVDATMNGDDVVINKFNINGRDYSDSAGSILFSRKLTRALSN